jgi:hypothetical protein
LILASLLSQMRWPMNAASGGARFKGPTGLGSRRTVSWVLSPTGSKEREPDGFAGPTSPSMSILRLGSRVV